MHFGCPTREVKNQKVDFILFFRSKKQGQEIQKCDLSVPEWSASQLSDVSAELATVQTGPSAANECYLIGNKLGNEQKDLAILVRVCCGTSPKRRMAPGIQICCCVLFERSV